MFRSFSLYRRALALFTLFLLVPIYAGCGGGGDSNSPQTASQETTASTGEAQTDTAPLSKSEFIKRASVICTQTRQRSSAAFREYAETHAVPASGPGLEAKAADLVETVFTPIYDKQIEEIGALGVPKGDEEEVDAMLAAMRQGVEGAAQEPLAFIRETAALDHASRLAVAYGLPACSNGNV